MQSGFILENAGLDDDLGSHIEVVPSLFIMFPSLRVHYPSLRDSNDNDSDRQS